MPNFVAAASFNRRCHQQHGSLLLCAAWNTLFRGSFRSSSSSNSRQHVAHWESRNPDTSTDSVIVRPTYLRTLTAPRNYSCTAAILSNKTNNDDAEEKLVAVWVRFCVDQGPLESDAVRLAIPATTPANCGIQVQALQRAVKDQCGHDEPALQGVPASWLQIHSSSSSFFQHRRPRTHQRSKKPPVPLDRNDIWDGTVHGGTSAETALVVHIDQANAWIQRPVVARNLNFIWIQVYTECAPIGPPARVSVPCASSYNDNEDDDDDSDMRSNQLLTSSSLVLDIRKAVKLAFANDLVGMSTATFQVFPSTWIPGSPSSSPPLDSQDYWTPNQTLSSSHGGLAEQSPLIVWVEPTQPVRPLPHESDSEQDNSNKHRNTSAWSQHVQGPLELRFPVFAHFIDKIRRPTWSADPFARQQITDACKEMAQNQSNSRRSIASSLRALLSEFVDGPMHKVPMTSITSGIEQNLGGNNNWGTTRMYRDDDMIVYLELKETMGSLTADPSLNDPYFQTKVKDKDDCFPCPHASFTVVLADIYVGVYGTVTNHTAVSSQQWLVPLLPITSIHQHLRYNQRLVNVLAALRDSIHELRQAISSASSSLSISDLPAIGSLTGLENLSLEHPMGKDTFLYRGKYGTNDVVVKICQSYCVEAHECLESTRLAPKIFWHGEIAGWKVIVMKYYAGRPRKKLKDKQVAMCEQVLAQLHNHGFVHGDARTSNFVWSPSQLPLLIDFDCSGPIGKTFHPPTAISGDEMDAIAIAGGKDYPVGSLVEPDHDFDMLSTRR